MILCLAFMSINDPGADASRVINAGTMSGIHPHVFDDAMEIYLLE